MSEILFNLVWIAGVLIVAFFGYRREWLRQKAEDAAIRAEVTRVDSVTRKAMKSYALQYIPLPTECGRYPELARDGFTLADMARRATKHPPDPPLPPLSRKRALAPGAVVRVGILGDAGTDPHPGWVRIDALGEMNEFAGTLYDAPDSHGRLRGLTLVLHANHIAEIVTRPTKGFLQ